MRSRRSTPTISQFVKELRKTWTSKFQDDHILLWNTRKVPAFENWFRRSNTTRMDMLFNETYNKINHLIPSIKNQNKWFMKCKVCLSYWDIGIVYCTCGHFLRKGTEENKKFVQYTMDLFSIHDYYIKKRATPRAPSREEARGQRVLHRQFAQEEVQKEELLGYPRPIHTRRKVPQEHD